MGWATMELVMAMFLTHIWSRKLPFLWVAVPSLSAGVNPAPSSLVFTLAIWPFRSPPMMILAVASYLIMLLTNATTVSALLPTKLSCPGSR